MSATELFTVPVSLSPRLQWKAKYEFRTHYCRSMGAELAQYPDRDIEPWTAWMPCNDAPNGDTSFPDTDRLDLCGFGKTEDDALVDCAKLFHIKLWNEEQE